VGVVRVVEEEARYTADTAAIRRMRSPLITMPPAAQGAAMNLAPLRS
jgi:hypothetical protein